MQPNITIKTIETNGIKVTIKVDYDAGTVSLVCGSRGEKGNAPYSPKPYLFANRGVEYMQGWLNVLEAQAEAIKVAKKDLEDEQKRKNDFVTDVLIEATEMVKEREIRFNEKARQKILRTK